MFDKSLVNRYSHFNTWAHKKRGAEAPRPVEFGSANYLCLPRAHRIPKRVGKSMVAKIINRRSDLRCQVYLALLSLPAESLNPATITLRGPPQTQTHYGFSCVSCADKKKPNQAATWLGNV